MTLFIRQNYISSTSPPSFPLSSTSPPATFFSSLLPLLLAHPDSIPTWKRLFATLSSTELARVADSLLRHLLAGCQPGQERRVGRLMDELVGREDQTVLQLVLLGGDGRMLEGSVDASIARARVAVAWIGGNYRDQDGESRPALHDGVAQAHRVPDLSSFLTRVVDLWADVQFVKYSLVSRHVCESRAFGLRG